MEGDSPYLSDSEFNAILLLINLLGTPEERSAWRNTMLEISKLPVTYGEGVNDGERRDVNGG